jgi:hypothetical protein
VKSKFKDSGNGEQVGAAALTFMEVEFYGQRHFS